MPLHVSQIPARPSTDFLDSSRATAPCHSSFEVPNPILKRVYLSERIHALPILQPFVLMVFHLMEVCTPLGSKPDFGSGLFINVVFRFEAL